jgi:hypothetical protein
MRDEGEEKITKGKESKEENERIRIKDVGNGRPRSNRHEF